MNKIALSDLYKYNYSVRVTNALKRFWRPVDFFDCMGNPKDRNIFLYLDGCTAEYTLKSGEIITAPSGSLVYAPLGSEYRVQFSDFETANSCTIGINFFLFDESGAPFIVSDRITVFRDREIPRLVEKIYNYSEAAVPCSIPCYGRMKSGVYDIISLLSEKEKRKNLKEFKIIRDGIKYMEEDANQLLSISEVAALCNVSEIYFRKLFKAYSGMTPIEYRINSKIEKAKNLLKEGNLNVTETATLLGFTDISYFCKLFKKHTGVTPLKYN